MCHVDNPAQDPKTAGLFFQDTIPDTQDRMRVLAEKIASGTCSDNEISGQVTMAIARIVADALFMLRQENRRFRESDYEWLSSASPDSLCRRDANKFLCACFLEYRAGKTDTWDNVAFFAEEILGDPENLWQVIHHHSLEEWKDRFFEYNLHPEPSVYERLHLIAERMLRFYAGDGRRIWTGYEQSPEEVFRRLKMLPVPRSAACLITGALKDQGYIHGSFDIVGDIVDSRVIGRMICGDGNDITPFHARRLARMMAPKDPWLLDRPLYLIGSTWCGPGPKCRACPVHSSCFLSVSEERDIKPDPSFRNLFFRKKSIQKTLRRWEEHDREEYPKEIK